MKQGVAYMAWGENAIRQSIDSMHSLWKFEPKMPVMVLGDQEAERKFKDNKRVTFKRVDVDPFDKRQAKGFKFLAGRIKPLITEFVPFDQVLYVDADTRFLRSPDVGFKLLDLWDLVIAETETRDLVDGSTHYKECSDTAKMIGTPYSLYHNSGMIFWRKNERTDNLFKLWTEEWSKYQNWDEQVALLRALLRSDALFLTVPYIWNCRSSKEGYLLHHWFGSAHARVEMSRGRHSRKLTVQDANRNPIIPFEPVPGVWVRIHDGDQEAVKKIYEARFRLKKQEEQ